MRARLVGQNIVVLDLETARSAEDCRYCGESEGMHEAVSHGALCRRDATTVEGSTFSKIGWDNKAALGLSIGCYYDYADYADARCHFFDVYTLEETMRYFVERQSLMVSFNGIAFDFPLMRSLLRQSADAMNRPGPGGDAQSYAARLRTLCDAFKTLCATSYDILAEIWKVDPARKFERGLNSLGAISQANGYGAKEMDGATAPRLWAQGRYAEVLNYCQGDVIKTRALFEQIVETMMIKCGDQRPIALPRPILPSGVLVGIAP